MEESFDLLNAMCQISEINPRVRRFHQIIGMFSKQTCSVYKDNTVYQEEQQRVIPDTQRVKLRQEQEEISTEIIRSIQAHFPEHFNCRVVEVSPEFFKIFDRRSWLERNVHFDPTDMMKLRRLVEEQGLRKYDLLVLRTPDNKRLNNIFISDYGLSGCTTDGQTKPLLPFTAQTFWRHHGVTVDVAYKFYMDKILQRLL